MDNKEISLEMEKLLEDQKKQEIQEGLSMALAKDNTYKKTMKEFSDIEKVLLSSLTEEQKKAFEEYDKISCEQEEYARMFYYKKGLESKEVSK